jgi:aminomethyltransferase
LVRCGLGARDTLRMEAGLPLYGHELDEATSPYEVGLGWAVRRNRPDLVGAAALERAAAAPPRRLVGLLVEGGIAREGAPVFRVGGEVAVGRVTSGTHSPSLGRPIAMALVARDAAGDAALEVEVRGKRRAASVTGLPFHAKRRAA